MRENKNREQSAGAENVRERKKHAAATAVAVVTSASLVMGGLFSSPGALLEDQELTPQPVYAQDDDLDSDGDGGPGGDQGDEDCGPEEDGGLRAPLRRRVLQLPYALRLCVILPLCALGWGLSALGTLLWSAFLSPLLGKALGWLLVAGGLLLAFLLAGKTIFPDLPWRKILNRRSISSLLVLTLLLGLADMVLPFFWADYTKLEHILRALGVSLVFGTVSLLFARRERRRRLAAAAVPAAEEPAEDEPWSREEILALADSVSRPRSGALR